MNDLVKNVLIASAIIGGIRLYGKVKYIQGIVDANKATNAGFDEQVKQKRTSYYYTEEGH